MFFDIYFNTYLIYKTIYEYEIKKISLIFLLPDF